MTSPLEQNIKSIWTGDLCPPSWRAGVCVCVMFQVWHLELKCENHLSSTGANWDLVLLYQQRVLQRTFALHIQKLWRSFVWKRSADDDGHLKHLFNCISPPSSDMNNIHEVCRFSTFMKGDSVTQWKPEWSPSAASLPKQLERICCVARKRLPEGCRCSFIKFWNLVLDI